MQGAVLLPFALWTAGCGTPDKLPPPDPLPEVVSEFLDPSEGSASWVAPGVVYREIRSGAGPWAIHLVEVDLTRCELGFAVLPSSRPEPGLTRVTGMLASAPSGVLAVVNGDFFTREGTPVGMEVAQGRLRSSGGRPVFSWRGAGSPWIGSPEVEGDSLGLVGWGFSLTDPDGATEVLGGFPELLDGGGRVGDLEVEARPDFAAARHPRTAVGFHPESHRLWLVVVDGRQEGYSAGMTLPELAELLERLGATEALNLDGGGSSVMVVGGRAVNRPSDAGGERAVVNALALRQDSTYCPVGPGPDPSGRRGP